MHLTHSSQIACSFKYPYHHLGQTVKGTFLKLNLLFRPLVGVKHLVVFVVIYYFLLSGWLMIHTLHITPSSDDI